MYDGKRALVKKGVLPRTHAARFQRVNRDTIARVMQAKRHRKAGTINRYLATIRTILRKAEREWGWIQRAPVIRMREEPRQRVRWITHQEAANLLAALPPHLTLAAEFSLATGLRQANVPGLQWAQIDLERQHAWIHADQAKAKRDLAVPLNARTIAVLLRCQGQHPEWVFTYRGEPLQGVENRTWKRACHQAGITDFRWHDLRHIWASWQVPSCIPPRPTLIQSHNTTPIRRTPRRLRISHVAMCSRSRGHAARHRN